MGQRDVTDYILMGVLAIIIIVAVMFLVGFLSQSETTVVFVNDKEHRTWWETVCDRRDDDSNCISSHSEFREDWIVYTDRGAFSVSSQLYRQIEVGRKHHVELRGFEWLPRVLVRVIE